MVAVLAEGRVLAGDRQAMATGHAEVLPGQIDAVLAEAGLRPSDIALFGATVGPGSFTGVRIGLATLAGLALGTGRPMVGITRFALYAACLPAPGAPSRSAASVAGHPPSRPPDSLQWLGPPNGEAGRRELNGDCPDTGDLAWVCLDSRRGPLFLQPFRAAAGAWQVHGAPQAVSPGDAAARVAAGGPVAGDAAVRLTCGGVAADRLVLAEPTPADLARTVAAAAGAATLRCPAPLYLAAAAVTPPP